jgi:hypothetical protein
MKTVKNSCEFGSMSFEIDKGYKLLVAGYRRQRHAGSFVQLMAHDSQLEATT